MGRGRQKAKQTKVARKLKYFSPDTDLDALQRELAAGHETHSEEQPDEGQISVEEGMTSCVVELGEQKSLMLASEGNATDESSLLGCYYYYEN